MLAAVAGLAFTSCEESAIDDLEGVYAAPTEVTITGVNLVNKEKEGNLRTFVLDLQNSQGVTIQMSLVSNKYFLNGTGYSAADKSASKNGNYVKSASTINGSAITDGTLNLTQNGDDYTVSTSSLFTEDGKAYRLNGAFTYSFAPDDPTPVNVIKSITTDPATNQVTVKATSYTYVLKTNADYTSLYVGDGYEFQVVFNTEDGVLKSGTYSPGTGYVAGYEHLNTTYAAWGYTYTEYLGTVWYTITDGAAASVPTLITSGDITVKVDGGHYTILLDQGKGGVYGQISGVYLNKLTGNTNYSGYGMPISDLTFTSGTMASTFDWTTYTNTITGTGSFLQLELYSADGTIATGTYSIANADADFAAGKFRGGYLGTYGNSGTYIYDVNNGTAGASQYVTSGTVSITQPYLAAGNSNYEVVLTTDEIGYYYFGPLTVAQ